MMSEVGDQSSHVPLRATDRAFVSAAAVAIYTFHVKYHNVMIPMRDGVKLAGDLYMPAIDGKPEEGRQFPCVLIRTPYNKSAENPEVRNPGYYWTHYGYCCFIQDVRGRFESEGEFYKYTGEAEDGYDTVEWIAVQKWCNGSICTDGPSYLCHVQTSMALLRPPSLKAMFCNKGGFFNAHSSGVRQGGAFEARQWVWGVKQAPRTTPQMKEAMNEIDVHLGDWLKRYPWKKADSPLSLTQEYEKYLFDQASNMAYGPYWKQIGLNTEEYLDDFADIPCIWLSGWYDIYCRSTIDFFTHLTPRKKGPHLLIMGPWQHVGPEGHVAGDVDFGVSALISGNLAPTVTSLARRWFDRWAKGASPRRKPLQLKSPKQKTTTLGDQTSPQSSSSSQETAWPGLPVESLLRGPSVYVLPSSVPKERTEEDGPLPPPVRYFRMGGGDGHKTSQGHMYHGGVWMAASGWPPVGTEYVNFYLGKRTLKPNRYDQVVMEKKNDGAGAKMAGTAASGTIGDNDDDDCEADEQLGQADGMIPSKTSFPHLSSSSSSSDNGCYTFTPHHPPSTILTNPLCVSSYDFDPRDPCPSIGGNVFGHRDVLLAGAFNQVERPGFFLCKPPYLPLSSRRDVLVFRTNPLKSSLDVTGMPIVKLIVSTSALDTDFTAKLIDEYPPSPSYPSGYAMQVTHGIRRCRFRADRTKPEWMVPGRAEEITIELYPTSNLFARGHVIRLDISSSNFPHFDLNMNTGEEFENQRCVVATNRVFHQHAYPSRLMLPIQTKVQKNPILLADAEAAAALERG